ncbi:hypothetical protein GIB67_033514, partial [Kingdonia uniflora]
MGEGIIIVFIDGVKSTVERKESLLDEVAEEETELELVMGELGLSRKKRVESKSKKVAKAQSARSMTSADEGEKVVEGQSISLDDVNEVEEGAWLAILQGKEDTGQMVARLVKGIWLGIEEQEFELKTTKSELEKNLARAKIDPLKEVKQLKATHAVVIGQFSVEAKANLDKTAKERDRLGHHLILRGYSQEEVDAIKADTFAKEDEEEVGVLGVVDCLDGVFSQIVLDNQGDDVKFPEDGSKKVELDASRIHKDQALMCNKEFVEHFDRIKKANENSEDQFVKVHFWLDKLNQHVSGLTRQVEVTDSGIKKGLKDLFEATERAENLRDTRLKAERDHDIARAKKAKARERSGGYHIRKLEGDASQIQGHALRGNANLRECQHKLDAALFREKVLEGELRAKDSLVKKKDELLKNLSVREELKAELEMFCARVVELQAMNLAESEQYITKLKGDAIRYDSIDANRNVWRDTYASVKVIVAYFLEAVKRLESERDTLLKTLSDKGCTCGAEIDR